jgi:hypothetical protein
MLSKLIRSAHRAAIETALIERERSLFNLDQTIYLYDQLFAFRVSPQIERHADKVGLDTRTLQTTSRLWVAHILGYC